MGRFGLTVILVFVIAVGAAIALAVAAWAIAGSITSLR